jgi:hypothetical protein
MNATEICEHCKRRFFYAPLERRRTWFSTTQNEDYTLTYECPIRMFL